MSDASEWWAAPESDVRSEWVFRNYSERPVVASLLPSTERMRMWLAQDDRKRASSHGGGGDGR